MSLWVDRGRAQKPGQSVVLVKQHRVLYVHFNKAEPALKLGPRHCIVFSDGVTIMTNIILHAIVRLALAVFVCRRQ